MAGCAADSHAPPFATIPYEPFSRDAAVAIALREWRLFGSPVDDDAPGARAPVPATEKPERLDGLWQRVGEYWYAGLDPSARETRWTGKHDGNGAVFPAADDGDYAWSAAFISYVMRIAGAGRGFPYAADHATYIDIAREISLGRRHDFVLTAQRPTEYAPQTGDLICTGRAGARGIGFDDLPAGIFPAHCDIVVAHDANMLSVIGGNVDDAVTLKHVPVTSAGMIAGPGGVLDARYGWFVVLRILYTV